MKILALSPGYLPAPGGAEASLHETLKFLSDNNCSCTVLTLSGNPSVTSFFHGVPDEEKIDNVTIVRISVDNFLSKAAMMIDNSEIILAQMFERFKELSVDIEPLLNERRKTWLYMQR